MNKASYHVIVFQKVFIRKLGLMMVLAIMEVLSMTAQLNVQLHYNFGHNFYGESHKKRTARSHFFVYDIELFKFCS